MKLEVNLGYLKIFYVLFIFFVLTSSMLSNLSFTVVQPPGQNDYLYYSIEDEHQLTIEGQTRKTALWNNPNSGNNKINLNQDFALKFWAKFSHPFSKNAGADGVVFVLHDDSRGDQAIGSAGGGIGYRKSTEYPVDAISPCLAVEFDTYNNNDGTSCFTDDISADHISIIHISGPDDNGCEDYPPPFDPDITRIICINQYK